MNDSTVHEREIITSIAGVCGAKGSESLLPVFEGIGDDCAVLPPLSGSAALAVTTDTMVEGVHFCMDYFTPWFVGRKLGAVNLSDMAAQGAVPQWAFLNLALPDRWRRDMETFVRPFAAGLCSVLGRYGAILAGGDTVAAPHAIMVSLTLMGRVSEAGWMRRSGACPGDMIYCSGPLGEAAAGLRLLERFRGRVVRKLGISRHVTRCLTRRHLDPVPRVGLGRLLVSQGLASAGMDISDGIATDLAHMCQASGTGAVLDAWRLPLSRALKVACRRWRDLGDPMDLALFGGEDFELLWAVPPEKHIGMVKQVTALTGSPPFLLGRMVDGRGVWLATAGGRTEITFQGYEH